MKNITRTAVLFVSSVILASCASAPVATPVAQAPADPYPEWFHMPIVENGIAAADCVAIPAGNISVARKKAIASARAELVKQIDVKVKAMDKTYDNLTTTNAGDSVGGTFESVSKQVASRSLRGARPIKATTVQDNGKSFMCVLVALSPEATDGFLKDLVRSSGANLSPSHEEVLKQQFLAYKAQQELEKELAR